MSNRNHLSAKIVAELRRVAEGAPENSLAVRLEEADGVVTVRLFPSRSTAAPVAVEVYDEGDVSVGIGVHGVHFEVWGDSEQEVIDDLRLIVFAIVHGGYREWLGGEAITGGPSAVAEIDTEGGARRISFNTIALGSVAGRPGWNLRQYDPY